MSIKQQGGIFGRNPSFNDIEANSFALGASGFVTDATTSRTLGEADDGKALYFTSGSAVTVTAPAGLGVGFSCLIIQGGAGQITVSAGSGATIVSLASLVKTSGQYAAISAISPVADTILLTGALGT